MRIEIPVSALARFVAGRQRIGNHLAQAARPEGDRPPAGHGRRQDVGPDHDLRGRLIWNAGRRVASPVTATTDFLAPNMLNKCGGAVPAHPFALHSTLGGAHHRLEGSQTVSASVSARVRWSIASARTAPI